MKELINFSSNKLEMTLRIALFKEEGKFVAYSPSLDLSGVGSDNNDAFKDLRAIIGLTFEEAIKEGSVNEMLFDLGWRKQSDKTVERPVFDLALLKKKLPAFTSKWVENLTVATA